VIVFEAPATVLLSDKVFTNQRGPAPSTEVDIFSAAIVVSGAAIVGVTAV
jgi:hypothetical protein